MQRFFMTCKVLINLKKKINMDLLGNECQVLGPGFGRELNPYALGGCSSLRAGSGNVIFP